MKSEKVNGSRREDMRRSIWNENDHGGHQWVDLKIQSLVSLGEWLDSSALCSLNACACIALSSNLRSRRRIFRAKEEI